jgi:poly(A) polymerase
VTTFRSRSAIGTAEHIAQPDVNNFFGTMEEDAERRDFTINALYYNPLDKQVIDYVGGVPDIRQRRLKTLVAAETSFAEDPVRMIRAVKYASLVGFPVPASMASLIKRMRESVLGCSRERVTEEVFKILISGSAADILELAHKLRLFEVMLPTIAEDLHLSRKRFAEHPFALRLRELDARTQEGKSLPRNDMFGFIFRDLVLAHKDLLEGEEPTVLIQQFIRTAAEPLFPSKKDLGAASEALLKEGRPHYRPAPARPVRSHGGPRREEQEPTPGDEPHGGTRRKRHRRGRGGRRRGAGTGPGPAPALG